MCCFCFLFFFFFFKQKTAYEIAACLVGSEMCIRDSDYTGCYLWFGDGNGTYFEGYANAILEWSYGAKSVAPAKDSLSGTQRAFLSFLMTGYSYDAEVNYDYAVGTYEVYG